VDLCKSQASLVYRVSSRTARATQRNPISKKKKKKKVLRSGVKQSIWLFWNLKVKVGKVCFCFVFVFCSVLVPKMVLEKGHEIRLDSGHAGREWGEELVDGGPGRGCMECKIKSLIKKEKERKKLGLISCRRSCS